MSGTMMRAPGVRTLLTIVVIGIFLSGCRTYGSHGSEAATFEQIKKAHQIFQEDLARRQADVRRLEQTAGESERLGNLGLQYAQLVRGQEAVVAQQAEEIADLSVDSDYRHLHRIFGAIISQQNTIRVQYEGLLTDFVQRQAPADSTVSADRTYSIIPPFYDRVEGRLQDLSVNEVLAMVASESGRASPGVTPQDSSPDSADGGQ